MALAPVSESVLTHSPRGESQDCTKYREEEETPMVLLHVGGLGEAPDGTHLSPLGHSHGGHSSRGQKSEKWATEASSQTAGAGFLGASASQPGSLAPSPRSHSVHGEDPA